MTKFLLAYTGGGGMADDEEAQKAAMAKWGAWMGGLGAALVDPGAPFSESKLVDGGTSAGLTGYSVLEAASLDDAVAKTKDCPIFESGGHLEVYESIPM
jgi:hypothetical protein